MQLAQAKALEAKGDAAKKNVARTTELLKAQGDFPIGVRADRGRRGGLWGRIQCQDARGWPRRARYRVFADHRPYQRADRPGHAHRGQPRQRRRQRSGADDHRGQPIRSTSISTSTSGPCSDTRKAIVDKQDRKQASSLRELKLPFSFGLDTDEGFPAPGDASIIAGNKVDQSHRHDRGSRHGAESRPAAWFPVPASASGCRSAISNKALLVPDTCVLTDQDRRYVLVLGQGQQRAPPGRRPGPAGGRRHEGRARSGGSRGPADHGQGLGDHAGAAAGAGERSRRAAWTRMEKW